MALYTHLPGFREGNVGGVTVGTGGTTAAKPKHGLR